MADASLWNSGYVLSQFWYLETNNISGTDYDGTPARTPVPPQTPGHWRQHQPPPVPPIVTTNTPAGMDNPFLVASNSGNTATLQHPWRLSPIHKSPCSATLSSTLSNHHDVPADDDDFQNIFVPSPATTQPSHPPPHTPHHWCLPAEGPNRPSGSLRAGQHSCTAAVARDGPAGNKTAHKAKDVWAFFDKTGGHSVCMICEWVIFNETYIAYWQSIDICMLVTLSMSIPNSNLAAQHLPFGLIWPNFILTSGLSIVTRRAYQQNGRGQKPLWILINKNIVKIQEQIHSQVNENDSPMKHLLLLWWNSSFRMIRCD